MTLRHLKHLKIKAPLHLPHTLRAKRRWRIEVVNENSLSRILSFRISGLAVWLAPLVVVAALASLIVVILAFTPIGRILPGRLAPQERALYADLAVKTDSLEQLVTMMDKFTSNINAILTDSLSSQPSQLIQPVGTDSLAGASDAEMQFVQQFEQRERFKLSVLSPLAADGMIFQSPFTPEPGGTGVSSVYRGAVVSAQWMPDGWWSVTVQHPNDFLSVYNNLSEVYVAKGARVLAGQRIGAGKEPDVELWHDGSRLDPADYLPDTYLN